MLSGWAGLQNGPLVPEAITKVTCFGVSNRCLPFVPVLKDHEPRRTRRSRKEIQLWDGFPSWSFVSFVVHAFCEKPLLARDSGSLASTIVQTIASLSAAAS